MARGGKQIHRDLETRTDGYAPGVGDGENLNAPPETTALAASGPRDRILRAASDLFYRKGIRAVGVDAIIASARVAKASFYHHFQSKDDLVVAWLRSEDARWLDRVTAETERRTQDPGERLLVFFDVIEEDVEQPGFRGCPYLNTAAELRDEPGPVRDAASEFVVEVSAYLVSLARAAGLRSPDEIGRDLHVLLAGVFAAALAIGDASPAAAARRGAETLVAAARQ
jgi:AcrR family transcriptional regulator